MPAGKDPDEACEALTPSLRTFWDLLAIVFSGLELP